MSRSGQHRQVEPERIDGRFVEEMNQVSKMSKSRSCGWYFDRLSHFVGCSQIDEVFFEIDTVGSGTLDRSEIRIMFAAKNLEMEDSELDRAMAELDEDGDGSVTLEEFEAWYWASPDGQAMEKAKAKAKVAVGTVDQSNVHLSYLTSSRMLMEQLYDAKTLAYIVLYLEYVIKHDLGAEYGLNEAGPSDLISQVRISTAGAAVLQLPPCVHCNRSELSHPVVCRCCSLARSTPPTYSGECSQSDEARHAIHSFFWTQTDRESLVLVAGSEFRRPRRQRTG